MNRRASLFVAKLAAATFVLLLLPIGRPMADVASLLPSWQRYVISCGIYRQAQARLNDVNNRLAFYFATKLSGMWEQSYATFVDLDQQSDRLEEIVSDWKDVCTQARSDYVQNLVAELLIEPTRPTTRRQRPPQGIGRRPPSLGPSAADIMTQIILYGMQQALTRGGPGGVCSGGGGHSHGHSHGGGRR